jgi:arsenate reductase
LTEIKIIHNPRCSKSRKTLELLESRNLKFETIDYLNGELTQKLLLDILKLLNKTPHDIIRTKEEDYKNSTIDWSNTHKAVNEILAHPKILERPIVIYKNKAIIARPPELVLDLLD